MSKIDDIYDNLTLLLSVSLPGYKRVPNPYSIDKNTYLHLRKGYGLAIGPGQDTGRYTGDLITWQRNFTVVLINQITTTLNNLDSRVRIEKDLLSDHNIVRKKIYLDSTLDGSAIQATVTDDQGVLFLDANQEKFLSLELNLSIEYLENANIL